MTGMTDTSTPIGQIRMLLSDVLWDIACILLAPIAIVLLSIDYIADDIREALASRC